MMLNDTWQIATAIPLLLCSIVAVGLIVDRAFFFMGQKDISQAQHQRALEHITAAQLDDALEGLLACQPFYHPVLLLMKKEQYTEKTQRDEQVSTLMVMHYSHLRQRLSALTTIASLAPMLGLLGTIIGLMRAFQRIGEHSGPVEPALVANGLWQALSTTAAGIVIAVICVLAHALFASKVKKMFTRSQFLLNSLSQLMHKQNKPHNEPSL